MSRTPATLKVFFSTSGDIVEAPFESEPISNDHLEQNFHLKPLTPTQKPFLSFFLAFGRSDTFCTSFSEIPRTLHQDYATLRKKLETKDQVVLVLQGAVSLWWGGLPWERLGGSPAPNTWSDVVSPVLVNVSVH